MTCVCVLQLMRKQVPKECLFAYKGSGPSPTRLPYGVRLQGVAQMGLCDRVVVVRLVHVVRLSQYIHTHITLHKTQNHNV